jgi:hypothetical protein
MLDKMPPLLPNEGLIQRVENFERTVATCLCTVPTLFSMQCLWVALVSPAYAGMYANFGSTLPLTTQFVISMRLYWILMALAVPVASLIVARKGRTHFSLVFSTISGLAVFMLAQFLTVALFLPIYQLATVAGGLSK